jgi:NADH-quinone oxidoreductase subunit M
MLTALIAIPLAGAIAVIAIGSRRETAVRRLGFAASGLALLVAAGVWLRFAQGVPGLQFEEQHTWVPAVGIGYHLGVDGLSVSLVALTAFLFPLALAAAGEQVRDRIGPFTATALLLEAGLLGTFLAQDLVMFYVFWEGMLIPMYFLIGLWGGPARAAAAMKFLLYTLAGSLLMLLAIIAVYLESGRVTGTLTFDLPAILGHPLGIGPHLQELLFAAFAVAFAIKMPVWPLHTWLPDAYAEAPPVVTVLLAGLMAKAGAYGLLRFCLTLFPYASYALGPALSVLAVIGILYGAAIAWTQGDMRRLLAYGSMSHMGFILLGVFALTRVAIQGSLIQMINHGISTGALFLLVGYLVGRTGRTRTEDYGGAAAIVPGFAAAFTIVAVSSLALPGTNGFIGEFLILLGTFQARPAFAAAATFGTVAAAAYLLALIGRVFHGPVRETLRGLSDLRPREYAVIVPLVAVIFLAGLFPRPLLIRSEATVDRLVHRVLKEQAISHPGGTGGDAAATAAGPPETSAGAVARRGIPAPNAGRRPWSTPGVAWGEHAGASRP